MKRCGRCNEDKPLEAFALSSARGRQSYCRACNSEQRAEWARANKDKVFWNVLWTKYRLTQEEYEEILRDQDYSCALCRKLFGEDRPHIDHDHRCCEGAKSCGECVRGLLCGQCNKNLGGYEYIVALGTVTNYLS